MNSDPPLFVVPFVAAEPDRFTLTKTKEDVSLGIWKIHKLKQFVDGLWSTSRNFRTKTGHEIRAEFAATKKYMVVTFTKLPPAYAWHQGTRMKMVKVNETWGPAEFTNILDMSTTEDLDLRFKFVFFHLPKGIVDASDAFFYKTPNPEFPFDVEFNVKGIKMGAHWSVVASSPVIAAMFESNQVKEGGTRCVDIYDTDLEVFEQMIRFLYTNVVLKLKELVLPLLVAADRFQIDSLKEICELRLSLTLNSYNVIHRLIVARKHSAAELLEASMRCLAREWKSIFQRPDLDSLLHIDPDLFNLAVGRIVSHLEEKEKESFLATLSENCPLS